MEEKGWLEEALRAATEEVRSWPEWVRFAAEFDPTALDESGETKKNMSKD